MKLNLNCTDKKKKQELILAICEITGNTSKYQGPPNFTYLIGNCCVDKNGKLEIDEVAYPEEAERITEGLVEKGYDIEAEKEVTGLCIGFPRKKLSDDGIERLKKLLEAKGSLIKQAFGIEELPVEIDDEKVSFPWFEGTPTPEETKAYSTFVCCLCKFAEKQKRVTCQEKEVDNPKYAFRTFLLRLGMIGDDTKEDRKILLSKLSGSASFKSGHKAGTEADSGAIPTPENTVKVDVEEALERLKDPQVQAEVKAILNGEDTDDEVSE